MKTILFIFILFLLYIFSGCNSGASPVEAKAMATADTNKVLSFEGKAANPLLIYAFIPWPGDRPTIISIDFDGGHNRFFIDHQVDSTTVDLPEGKGRFSYSCLGKLPDGIYVVRTTVTEANNTTQNLLFFSFKKRKIIYDDNNQSDQTLITLEKFYQLGNGEDVQVMLNGTKVTVDIPGADKKHIELLTDKDNGSQAILDNNYPPNGIAATALGKDWQDADTGFYFHGNPINPYLLNELSGAGFDMSDGPSTYVVDIEAGSVGKQFEDTASKKGTGFNTTTVENGFTSYSSFGYEYLGKTTNGVHVIRTTDSGGGSGVFGTIRFIRFRPRKAFDCNGVLKDQLLMCLERSCGERDRSSSVITIKGNTVTLDIPERPTPVDEATDTTHVVEQF